MNVWIVDDEPDFAASLAEKIRALPDFSPKSMTLSCLTVPSEYYDPQKYVACDLLFLDIELKAASGMMLARQLLELPSRPILIFVSNFIEYSPEGYEVNAFRFLSKGDLTQNLGHYFSDAVAQYRGKSHILEITCEGNPIPVAVSDLVYVESLGHEQRLHCRGGLRQILTTRTTLRSLEEHLCPWGFLRVHKGFLVNMAFIQSFKSTILLLTTGESLPVGARTYRNNKRTYLLWRAQQL